MASSRGIVHRRASTVVAIDLGSHGTGFAYSIDGGPSRIHSSYPDQPTRYPKTLTAILYRGRSPVAIGWTARKRFLELPVAGEDTDSYRLVTAFKLLLHDPRSPLVPERPQGVNEIQVVADFLKMFKQYAVAMLRRELGPGQSRLVAPDAITYVATVPAMWSDQAKGRMRDACVRAGIIPGDRPEQLVLGLEPEAAALHAMHSHAALFEPGQIVMVADGGGGTFDWTIHECCQRGGHVVLREAAIARGEQLGALQVDNAFSQRFAEEVGVEAFNAWKVAHPTEHVQLMSQWENVKCLVGGEQQAPGEAVGEYEGARITILPALYAIISAEDKARLAVEHGGDDSVVLDDEALRGLFDPTIHAIIEATLAQMQLVEAGHVDKVLLVGGFCSSPYLQQRISEALQALPNAPQVVLVDTPYAAVLRGAVLFGADPSLVSARKARYSYGVKYAGPYVEGAPERFWNAQEQNYFSAALFWPYVEQGQEVEYDELIDDFFLPVHREQTQCDIEVFIVDQRGARFIDEQDEGTRKLANLVVNLGPATSRGERLIKVSFKFGRADIRVSAMDESTEQELRTTLSWYPPWSFKRAARPPEDVLAVFGLQGSCSEGLQVEDPKSSRVA